MSLYYAITRVAAKKLNNPACFTRSLRRMGSVSAIDSGIFRSLFGTDEIRQVCNGNIFVNPRIPNLGYTALIDFME
jgi:hypothetical protein